MQIEMSGYEELGKEAYSDNSRKFLKILRTYGDFQNISRPEQTLLGERKR